MFFVVLYFIFLKYRILYKVYVVKEWLGILYIILLKFWNNVGVIIIINYFLICIIVIIFVFLVEFVNIFRMLLDVSEDIKNGVIFNIV